MGTVKVTRQAAMRFAAGHPWAFQWEVEEVRQAQPGDAVRVLGPDGRFIGIAHYSSTSRISLRLLTDRDEAVDRDFYFRRLRAALEYRRQVVESSDAYRVVHSEADRLPALIVDRYADYLVIQTLSQGMERAKSWIVEALLELFAPKAIVERNDVPRRDLESLPRQAGVIYGELPELVEFHMNGLTFYADLLRGQKTGAFLDQRENYVAVARYARGEALDCFTSGGGFALHIAPRCRTVEGVDSSETALALAERNRQVNGVSNVTFRLADAFELLTGYAVSGRRFDTVVLDPPGFAKTRSEVKAALRAYRQLNYRALQLLNPGGVLVTCTCSHHVTDEEFMETVASAAREQGKLLRVLERRVQALDHPVLLSVPESLYLRCLIFQVVEDG